MTVLVTGSNGFVGAAVALALHEAAVEVRPCSRRDVGQINGQTDWSSVLNAVSCSSDTSQPWSCKKWAMPSTAEREPMAWYLPMMATRENALAGPEAAEGGEYGGEFMRKLQHSFLESIHA